MRPRLAFILVALLLFLPAIARAQHVPGETSADSVLQRTVLDTIEVMELAGDCSTSGWTVTDTKITVPFDGKTQQEKWTVKSCNGESHLYQVTFIPSPQGGTDVRVGEWPS